MPAKWTQCKVQLRWRCCSTPWRIPWRKCNGIDHFFVMPLDLQCMERGDVLAALGARTANDVQSVLQRCHRRISPLSIRVNSGTEFFSEYDYIDNIVYYNDPVQPIVDRISSEAELIDFLCTNGAHQNIRNFKNAFCAIQANFSLDNCSPLVYDRIQALSFYTDSSFTFHLPSLTDLEVIRHPSSDSTKIQFRRRAETETIEKACRLNATNYIDEDYCLIGVCHSVDHEFHWFFQRCISRTDIIRIEGLIESLKDYYQDTTAIRDFFRRIAELTSFQDLFNIIYPSFYHDRWFGISNDILNKKNISILLYPQVDGSLRITMDLLVVNASVEKLKQLKSELLPEHMAHQFDTSAGGGAVHPGVRWMRVTQWSLQSVSSSSSGTDKNGGGGLVREQRMWTAASSADTASVISTEQVRISEAGVDTVCDLFTMKMISATFFSEQQVNRTIFSAILENASRPLFEIDEWNRAFVLGECHSPVIANDAPRSIGISQLSGSSAMTTKAWISTILVAGSLAIATVIES